MNYELSVSNITANSADITVSCLGQGVGDQITGVLSYTPTGGSATTRNLSNFEDDDSVWSKTYALSGLLGATEYTVNLYDADDPSPVDIATPITFTTFLDIPRTATQSQWEDLANRIKAKADASDMPTITLTTTYPGEGSALAENNYVGVYGGDPIIMDYSTNEVNTGAKWIDGSTIYKKTIEYTITSSSGSGVEIASIGSIRPIKLEGFATWASEASGITIPYYGSNSDNARGYISNGKLYATWALNDANNRSFLFTVYYTKSS